MIIAPKTEMTLRRRTSQSQAISTMMTVIETWKLGKQLSSALIGRNASIRFEVHMSDSRIAPDPGNAHRSGTGKSRKNARLIM